jgi:hypothetical protein
MRLEVLGISPGHIKAGMSVIWEMQTLKTIRTDHEEYSAEEFRTKFDPGARK